MGGQAGPGSDARGHVTWKPWVPRKDSRYKYPILFVSSPGRRGDQCRPCCKRRTGGPGGPTIFVNRGYMGLHDGSSGARAFGLCAGRATAICFRRGPVPLMEEVWSGARPPSTPQSSWPQASKHTQWPGDGPDKGKMGDPIFDYFAKTDSQAPTGKDMEQLSADDIVALVDLIHQPVVLLLHSGVAPSGWLAADARPKLVKGIIAAEPVAPPIENAERGGTGPGRVWGLTNMPITYDPPIKSASELQTVREEKAEGPDLIPCWVQKEPAHKLINLVGIPVLNVSGEASYHRPYAHCVAGAAQSSRSKDHVREARRCGNKRERPPVHVREE